MNSLLKDRKRFLEAAAAQPVVEHKRLLFLINLVT